MKRITINIPKSKKRKALEIVKQMNLREAVSYETYDIDSKRKTIMFSMLVTDKNVNDCVAKFKEALNLGKAIKEGVMTVEDTVMALPDISEKKTLIAPQVRIKRWVQNYSKLDKYEISFLMLAILIASFGLLLDNFFIVVGAMLIAPIMNPIISSSFSVIKNYGNILAVSLKTQAWNYIISILLSAIVGFAFLNFVSPIMGYYANFTVIHFIIYFSLATVIGIAAALSFSSEMITSFVGVAVSIALLPPLVLIGLSIPFNNFYLTSKAIKIFCINLLGMHIGASLSFIVLREKVLDSKKENSKK